MADCWMAQGACTYLVAVNCDTCPRLVHLLLDLVDLGNGRQIGGRQSESERYEKGTMQVLAGLLLLLLLPPPSESAADAAGLQELIIS